MPDRENRLKSLRSPNLGNFLRRIEPPVADVASDRRLALARPCQLGQTRACSHYLNNKMVKCL